MARKVIVMPDDTIEPILAAIGAAAKSLRIKMFSVSDRRVLSALVKAHKRKVKIRVLLNPARHSGEIQNKGARALLLDAGIDVLDTNPGFTVTHEKSMVVDDATAFIGSLNWDPDNFEETREFAVTSDDPAEVAEVIECFEADWSRQPFKPRPSSNLIWCPDSGRDRIAQFIDAAKHSLFVQNERYQDTIIVESRAVVGSINLTSSSFDERRELAIHLSDPDVVERLATVIHEDWQNSHALDLSDRAVLSDLERHPKNSEPSRIAPVALNQAE
jgi:cardiolipin synthase